MTAATVTPGTREIQETLAAVLDGDVRVDPYTRHLYSSDASMYAIEPLAVAFPRHAGDARELVRAAGELGVPVLPRGAGTSLAGQTVGRAVVVDFPRYMGEILEIDADARTARVQPGVVQDQLNDAASVHGLMFGPDTSTSNRATVGGMVGNNSAGSRSVRYGSTIDHVDSLDVVLADASTGTFTATPADGAALDPLHRDVVALLRRHADALTGFPPYWRHAGGYRLDRVLADGQVDLSKLVVGSEGTLAVVTEATVRLVPSPRHRALALGHFTSTAAAIAATTDALALDATSVELMDRAILDLSRQRPEYAGMSSFLVGDPGALLFVEFSGDEPGEVASRVDALAKVWERHGHGYHTLRATEEAQQAAVLKVRKASLGLLMNASVGTRRPLAFVEDTAVPPENLVAYVRDFAAVLDRYGLQAGFYGHCSVGCLHVRPFVDVTDPEHRAAMRAVAEEVSALAWRHGGVNSSEHGDGLVRAEFSERLFGPEVYEAMREVKRLFDPSGRLNPGKIVDPPSMTDNLRDLGPAAPAPLRTRLAFDGGMRAAADRCMNIGACRKSGSGVMCPSYMATREEEHSTRGRANALVHALGQPDPAAALGDERLHEILDLCLGCKACKSECPLGVDMAALKSEALAGYHEVHGTPLRARVLGDIRRLNRLGSAFAPLSNWPMRLGPVRALLERRLGVSRSRPLPAFARGSLVRWHRRRPAARAASRGDLVLLADSFTSYSEPAIGRAAVELLEAAGWRVHLTPADACCGRASISTGLLDRAADSARGMVDALTPFAERGVQVAGIEPSCLLTLVDEYPSLLPGDARVAEVARNAVLVPDLLVQAIDEGSLVLDPDADVSGRRIVFHGHCHEKAVVGTAASRALLERIPGADVVELDAGCCGMAGSFGYEAEHYELSMQVGGLRLFPALQAEASETLVAATGTSCRQQIAHGTRRAARHPVEFVRAAVRTPAGSGPG